MQAVVIVAHPDDEVIWCGGLLLQKARWDWTVVSLCRGDDRDRTPKFAQVCERLGVRGIISDLNDEDPPSQIDPIRDIGDRIRRHAADRHWDLCVTHGADGEYGHQRHREIHHEVVRLAAAGALRCRDLWTFAYRCDKAAGRCQARETADILLPLTDAQLNSKKRIVQELYGYGPDCFEVEACVSPEGFDRRDPHASGGD